MAAEDETRAWAGLATAQPATEFCSHWLTIQCLSIPGAVSGLVLMEDQPGAWSPVATWPGKTHDVSGLRNAAERALRDGHGVVIRTPSGEADLALPVLARNQKWCAVAIKMSNGAEADFVRTMRSLHWGSGWL